MKDRIAVLMTVHNRRETTIKCLNHFMCCESRVSERIKADIYLVDDASTDGTSESVQNQFPDVMIIKGSGNLFWNRGMLLAWEKASKSNYDYYLWLNDDTILYSNALNIMLDVYDKCPESIIVGCTHATNDQNKTTYGGFDKYGKIVSPNGNMQQVETINGNFVLISRSVYLQCGMFSHNLHHSGGDNYYSIVAKMKGIPCILTPCYIGFCDNHEKPKKYCDPDVPLIKRLKNLYSPLGNPPSEIFFLSKLKKGPFYAAFEVVLLHCHALFPNIWNKMRGRKNQNSEDW